MNGTFFQLLQCYQNGLCIWWCFVLHLYTTPWIPLSCGHLPVQSCHCHAHVAIRSRALCSLGFKLADRCYMGNALLCKIALQFWSPFPTPPLPPPLPCPPPPPPLPSPHPLSLERNNCFGPKVQLCCTATEDCIVPAGLLTILGALNKPSLGVSKSLQT